VEEKAKHKALAVVPLHMEQVILDIVAERARQDAKFGDQTKRTPFEWLAILTEELGEVAKEVCETGFIYAHTTNQYLVERSVALRDELVQTAAVAVAMIEAGDRACWWPMTDAPPAKEVLPQEETAPAREALPQDGESEVTR
jgi:NTP pyrophosphatase (non-canonical NTP hydrolase)